MSERKIIAIIHSGHHNDFVYCENMTLYYEKMGYTVNICSLHEAGFSQFMQKMFRNIDGIFCIISISYYAFHFDFNGKFLHEVTNVPVVIYEMDFTWLHANSVPRNITPNIILTACVSEVADFWHQYFCRETTSVLANIGHGLSPKTPLEPMGRKQFMDRKTPIFMDANFHTMNLHLDEITLTINSLHGNEKKVVWAATEISLRNTCITVPDAVTTACTEMNIEIPAHRLICCFRLLDMYQKTWRRHEILKDILHLPILISGDGIPAEIHKKHPEKFCIKPMAELFSAYQDAVFTINTNNGVDSIHPRILNSIFSGSVPVLQQNFATDKIFNDGKSAIFFNFKDKPISQALEEHMDDRNKAYEIQMASRQALIEADVLDHNFRAMENAVKKYWGC